MNSKRPRQEDEENRSRVTIPRNNGHFQQVGTDNVAPIIQRLLADLSQQRDKIQTSAAISESQHDAVSALTKYASHVSFTKIIGDMLTRLQMGQPSTDWCQSSDVCVASSDPTKMQRMFDAALNQSLAKISHLQIDINKELLLASAQSQQGGGGGGRSDKNEDSDVASKCLQPVSFAPGSDAATNSWFDRLEGMEKEKEQIRRNFIAPMLTPMLHGRIGKGLLFFGPPGTGKTALIKAAVNELQQASSRKTALIKAAVNELQQASSNIRVLFFAPTAADLKGKYFGESEKNIKAVFECASSAACSSSSSSSDQDAATTTTASIIFLDEVETLAGRRDKDSSGFMTTTVNALLQAMDGVETPPNVAVIAATNYPWELDTAFLRRFSETIAVDMPDASAIQGILESAMTRHLQSLVDEKSFSDSLHMYCARKRGGKSTTAKSSSTLALRDQSSSSSSSAMAMVPTGGGAGGGARAPITEVKFDKFAWKTSPLFKSFTCNLTENFLSASAIDAARKGYSHSDIDRVFKTAVRFAGKEAEEFNLFVELPRIASTKKSSPAHTNPTWHMCAAFIAEADLLCLYSGSEQCINSGLGGGGGLTSASQLRLLCVPDDKFLILGAETFVCNKLLPLIKVSDANISNMFWPIDLERHRKASHLPVILQFKTLFRVLPSEHEARRATDSSDRQVTYYVRVHLPKKTGQLSVRLLDREFVVGLFRDNNKKSSQEARLTSYATAAGLLNFATHVYLSDESSRTAAAADPTEDFDERTIAEYKIDSLPPEWRKGVLERNSTVMRLSDDVSDADLFRMAAGQADEDVHLYSTESHSAQQQTKQVTFALLQKLDGVNKRAYFSKFKILEQFFDHIDDDISQTAVTFNISDTDLAQAFKRIIPTVPLAQLEQLRRYNKDPTSFAKEDPAKGK